MIADKLDAEIIGGRKHEKAVVRVNGTYIGQFGIRRSKNVGHGYIPRQIGIRLNEAIGLARCHLYKEDYERILRERGKLPSDGTD